MKRLVVAVAVLGVLAFAALGALPTTATVGLAADLALHAHGEDGVAAQGSGCTRVTNRFCVIDVRDNCRACR